MPGIPLMKRTILRVRERENAAPGIPQLLYDLVIPEEYKKTSDGKSFLLFDSFDHDPDNCDRFLLFSTEENLQKMSECDHWYADGTFSCAPSIFKQLYTIHGIQSSNVLPSVYALLPNKKKKTYIRLLQSLKTLNCNLKPKTVMLDFEIGAMTAFKKEFGDIKIRGCHFHFAQSIWRHIQECGLSKQYKEDSTFAFEIKKLNALAYVPVDYVVRYFEYLVDTPFYRELESDLSRLLDYFEETWVGKMDRNGKRKNPKFSITIWNCYVDEYNLPKTNNSVEGWHNSFSSILNAIHPSIWKFIRALQKEEKLNRLKMVQYCTGAETPRKRKKYNDTAERINTICKTFNNRTFDEYISGIAHNL